MIEITLPDGTRVRCENPAEARALLGLGVTIAEAPKEAKSSTPRVPSPRSSDVRGRLLLALEHLRASGPEGTTSDKIAVACGTKPRGLSSITQALDKVESELGAKRGDYLSIFRGTWTAGPRLDAAIAYLRKETA